MGRIRGSDGWGGGQKLKDCSGGKKGFESD